MADLFDDFTPLMHADVTLEAQMPLFDALKTSGVEHDLENIHKAVAFTLYYHDTQTRASGELYYHHPIAVAAILAWLKLDSSTIITAILHDTVEDTNATLLDIEKHFGAHVASLVDGVTKLTQMKFRSDNHKQAENFRKLLLAISEDIRVLLIKLADRLHNMQTLHYLKRAEKRRRIAHETMEIYATLAERIGMHQIKEELQDIAFQELHPDAYASIVSRLEFLRQEDDFVEKVIHQLQETIENAGIKASIAGREKSPYSIWRKMQKKDVNFEQMTDIMAFRIITENKADCYQVLGILHSHYHAMGERFKDYISTPKDNGYQSIHTSIIGPERQRVEVQIRTHHMHEIAEMGVAAHWAYKQDAKISTDGRMFRWIRELLHIIEHTGEPEEFLEHSRLEMYHDQVFCFTPKGDLIALPQDGTPVDFAFSIHSEVGRTCVGSKINGRIMPLRTKLKNGDQVEILQSKNQTPSPSWEHFVVTGKARAEIRKFIRAQQRDEYVQLGKSMLESACEGLGQKLDEKGVAQTAKSFNKHSTDDLYAALGDGTLLRNDVLDLLFPHRKQVERKSFFERFRKEKLRPQTVPAASSMSIRGLVSGMAIHYAGCCHPLPGETIVGIVNTGKGVTIHGANCHELQQYLDQPERWVDISWEEEQDGTFVARLKATVTNKKGALASLANTIAKEEANINNVRILHRADDFYDIILDIDVHDRNHLHQTIAALRMDGYVHTIERYQEGR